MTSSTMVHLNRDDSYGVDVRHSLAGAVSLSLTGDLTIFCMPEQALKLAADIIAGVVALPKLTAEEQAEADKQARQACGF